MTVGDLTVSTATETREVPSPPAVPRPMPAPVGTPPPAGISREAGQLLALAFGIAWIACPLIEPMPSEPMPHYPLWQLPIDLAAVASIVGAVAVLWRGRRNGPRLGAIAGVLMAVETIICPIAGHTTVGWWTWTQGGLSLFVLGTSAALMARPGWRAAAGPPA